MAEDTRLMATKRDGTGAGPLVNIQANQLGEQIVAHGLPPYTEMARPGNGYQAMNTSALAALVVRPSTTANFTLFNNNSAGGRSFIIIRAFAFNLVSTAAEARSSLWLCSHKPGLVSPTADITAIKSLSCKSGYGGGAVCDTAMTVIDDGWFPWGVFSTVEPTGVLPGAMMEANIDGRIIVPPQCGVSTQVVSGVTGNTFTTGFTWFEEQLTTE